ncbi:MAG: metallophosphoesterase [Winkia neuii]|uniref:Metallophosphoesterase n=1 Tax=Winkia neuii TaxID=33007 RepID=A0A2I1IPT0_9ACTO|nr:metallophosphoesterase [Winkia neuii]OFJ72141.1 hypothetical protein HMPREF2851_04220 [Actinomyces sp. HMSC064C12]OFK02161.1 hypothetical protein HMPREF2835_07455 [Actinomyces sp. HMSC072A03]OFT54647.1 hypothetical protein HMPREF3152_09260 [Actinomyces sp. HMSC06A08]KWZ74196.1 Ser/Thr phosphatase family protein [Winkia neuii]MDK8098628.1 metallophosphoesterase [Winkia neuii]
MIRAAKVLGAGALVGLAGLVWGSVERRFPKVTAVSVPGRPGTARLRILQVADAHLWPSQRWEVDFIASAADVPFSLCVNTGDNFSDPGALDMAKQAFAPLLRRPGVFTFGSNDYFGPHFKNPFRYFFGTSSADERPEVPDLPHAALAEFFEGAWQDVRNRAVDLQVRALPAEGDPAPVANVSIMGVDDPHIDRDRVPSPPAGWEQADLRIGVSHAPYRRVLDAFTEAGADLIICGHTHGGQVRVPFVGALVNNSDIPLEYASGLHDWCAGGRTAKLFVSKGLGTSKTAPLRFWCRPEIAFIDINPAN